MVGRIRRNRITNPKMGDPEIAVVCDTNENKQEESEMKARKRRHAQFPEYPPMSKVRLKLYRQIVGLIHNLHCQKRDMLVEGDVYEPSVNAMRLIETTSKELHTALRKFNA
jgi:hypothetical protein